MATPVRSGEEAEFSVFGRRMAAKLWGDAAGTPTIALHGWLDNANTFDRLAPLLPELNLLALDFAGHGRSDHRPDGAHYHSLTDVQDVLAIAQQLGWERFNLIGHSMGGSISSELTATFPERIERALFIDGFMATGGVDLDEQIARNRSAIEKMLNTQDPAEGSSQSSFQRRGPKVYPDPQTMARRVTEATDQSFEAAVVLVERGHKAVADGVTWRTDPRIRFPTPLRYSREVINRMLQNSLAPSLLLVAEQGDRWYQSEIEASQQHHPKLEVRHMPGPHHLHLEPAFVDGVAAEARAFFGLSAAATGTTAVA